MSKGTDARLIIVANRLPITIKRQQDGEYRYSLSSGGLVTGLSGLAKTTKFLWYGWPGINVPEQDIQTVESELKDRYSAVPLWIDDGMMELHYNGFSNAILWPLFHYHPDINFDPKAWKAYVQVNQQFAQTTAKDIRDNDMIWVHDYHLMLLPRMLREELEARNIKVKIGFFLHTPFPSSEIYRILPVRDELMRGLLHCDLVGFHTYDYARHFLSTCARVIGLTTTPSGVTFQNRDVHVGAFPIGIDPEKFIEGLKQDATISRARELSERFKGKRIIVGVDRLDYIKGIPQKLHAFEMFLEHHPEWLGQVVLIQVAIPSRQDVKEYQNLRAVVSELVGKINGRFGAIDYTPIKFVYNSIPFYELLALYSVADVCFITSTRDGMNLVAYEYIMCQKERHGQLILSEFTGAAQSLKGCIEVNPWNTDDLMNGLQLALTMSDDARAENHDKLYEYVNKYTSAYWGMSFVEQLRNIDHRELNELQMKKTAYSPTMSTQLPSPLSPLSPYISTSLQSPLVAPRFDDTFPKHIADQVVPLSLITPESELDGMDILLSEQSRPY